VTRRSRIAAIAAIVAAVGAGIACLVAIGGATGGLLAIVLIGGSLGGGMLLLFLEVGLSEERERAAASERQPERPVRHEHPPRLRGMARRPRRLGSR
jgi:Na+/glutamate symporter